MNGNFENNRVNITGEIISEAVFDHQIYGEKFYKFYVKVGRLSGYYDFLPVIISERLIDVSGNYIGDVISISGRFRSFNRHTEDKPILKLYIFVLEIDFIDAGQEGLENNCMLLRGFICKKPTYRVTPLGREVSDLLLAVNRPYGKSDYIPCICWGRNALFAETLEVGTRVKLSGRIQSREYRKNLPDRQMEIRVAYEVSASQIEVVEE